MRKKKLLCGSIMWHAEAANAEEVPKPEEEAPMRKKPLLCRRSSYAEEAPVRKNPLSMRKKPLCGRRSSYAEVLCGTRKPLTLKKFLSLKKKLLCERSPYAEEEAPPVLKKKKLLRRLKKPPRVQQGRRALTCSTRCRTSTSSATFLKARLQS